MWALGSLLVDTGSGLVESAGDAYSGDGFAYKLARGREPASIPADPYEVFAAPGAAPLFRRDVLERLGGYYERYFLYYEDVDLAFRARLLGYRAVMVPRARVNHAVASTSIARGRIYRLRYLVARNSLWCAVRNLPEMTAGKALASTLADLRSNRPRRYHPAYLAGRAAGTATLPRALRERRAIQATRTVDIEQVRAFLEPPPELAP